MIHPDAFPNASLIACFHAGYLEHSQIAEFGQRPQLDDADDSHVVVATVVVLADGPPLSLTITNGAREIEVENLKFSR